MLLLLLLFAIFSLLTYFVSHSLNMFEFICLICILFMLLLYIYFLSKFNKEHFDQKMKSKKSNKLNKIDGITKEETIEEETIEEECPNNCKNFDNYKKACEDEWKGYINYDTWKNFSKIPKQLQEKYLNLLNLSQVYLIQMNKIRMMYQMMILCILIMHI